MNNFEAPKSINQIFENRKKHIPEIGEQLKKETQTEVEIDGERLNMDYRMISVKEKEGQGDAVVVLPGFGSGWEGISELGFSLSCEDRKVIMPSLPGYGKSDNPSEKYYNQPDFDYEAEALSQLLDKIGESGKKYHLIGHSMGSEILATLAKNYPEKVASLVLLNPAGVKEKENPALMGSKFVLSGAYTSSEFAVKTMFSGEKDYENELKDYIPKTQSPFEKGRMKQRLVEVKKLTKGKLLEKIKSINIPITYISGQLDSVFPSGSQLQEIAEAVRDKTKLEKSVMMGLRHNTTIAPDEITAANINHYLELAEQKNAKEKN